MLKISLNAGKILFSVLILNLILANALKATTKYEGTWKGWFTSDTTLECGFSRNNASMTVSGAQFVIKTEDATGNRLVIGSINENKVKQFVPFTIVNEFANEENLAVLEGFFGNSSFYGTIIVEALTPGGFSSHAIFCEAKLKLDYIGPEKSGFNTVDLDQYLIRMKKFLDTGQLTQGQFANLKAQIKSDAPSYSKTNGANNLNTENLGEKLQEVKNLYEKDLISKKQYEKLRNKILGLD